MSALHSAWICALSQVDRRVSTLTTWMCPLGGRDDNTVSSVHHSNISQLCPSVNSCVWNIADIGLSSKCVTQPCEAAWRADQKDAHSWLYVPESAFTLLGCLLSCNRGALAGEWELAGDQIGEKTKSGKMFYKIKPYKPVYWPHP